MHTRIIYTITFFIAAISYAFSQSKFSEQTIKYFDSARQRNLVTEIWIPERNDVSALPLVLFSHGTGGNRLACRWFCEGLAGEGFIVAAVDHYGNTFDNPIPKEFVTIWQQPQDISFVLSELLKDIVFKTKIDSLRIYAAGFSIGGYTCLALAGAKLEWKSIIRYSNTAQGHKEINIPEMPGLLKMFQQDSIARAFKKSPDLLDKRIKAVFVMSPAAGQGFSSKKQMRSVNVPVFIVAAESDSIAPIKTNASHYKALIPNAEWYLLKGKAGHYVFLNEGTIAMKNAAPVYFRDEDGVNRNEIHKQVIGRALVFFNNQN